ncbi:hypothetical protein [Primorskyibacter sp. 2E233]|uniref:hypothetical protein n=1 Tax=Primorskyibacter sp. 2E233 TaxID=3413431 RepID=UPI003BF2D829
MNILRNQFAPPRAFNNPPPVGEYLVPIVRDNEHGTVISVQRAGADNPAFGFLPFPEDRDSDALKTHLDTLKNTIGISTVAIATKAKDVHPHRMAETALQVITTNCRRSFKDTVSALQAMKRQAATGRKEFVDLHVVNPSIAPAISARFVAMDQPAILQTIATMGADQLAVLLSMRGLINLPDEIWRDVQIRYVIQANLSGERSDGVGIAAKQPSLDDPAAIGIDQSIVAEWAEARMKFFDQQESRVDDVAASLKNICAVLAVACDKTPNDLWSALYE